MPLEFRPDCDVDGFAEDRFEVEDLFDAFALLLDVDARLFEFDALLEAVAPFDPRPFWDVEGREPP